MRYFDANGEAYTLCDYCGQRHEDDAYLVSYNPAWPQNDVTTDDFQERLSRLNSLVSLDNFMDAQGPFAFCPECDIHLLNNIRHNDLDFTGLRGMFSVFFVVRLRTLKRLLENPTSGISWSANLEGEIEYNGHGGSDHGHQRGGEDDPSPQCISFASSS